MRVGIIVSILLSSVFLFYTNCGKVGEYGIATIAGDAAAGEVVYTSVTPACVSCHGASGGGVFGQAGSIVGKAGKVMSTVRSGISTMPGYSTSDISDQELIDLAAYVATFTP
ncbi:MAG: cytochrome c [Bdellovibrionaceae bacterium]|nr:cytochrome c [Pseudobdellovibrionaceae bacterium]